MTDYNVADFSAIGDGRADDTAAIQAAINAAAATGGTVHIPGKTYRTTAPLRWASNVHVKGAGGLKTTIRPDHSSHPHAPAFMAPKVKPYYWQISDLRIDFSGCGTPSKHAEDIGIASLDIAHGSAYFGLENLYIRAAHTATALDAGEWQGRVSRIWAKHCRNGFRHRYGTTMKYTNCFAEGSANSEKDGKGWDIDLLHDSVLDACAMDNYYTSCGVHFSRAQGLTINGFTAENNELDGSRDGRMFYFENCAGIAVNGFTPIGTKIRVPDNAAAALICLNGGNGTFNGIHIGGEKLECTWNDCATGGNSKSTADLVRVIGARPAWAFSGSRLHQLTIYPDTDCGNRRTINKETASGRIVLIACERSGDLVGDGIQEIGCF